MTIELTREMKARAVTNGLGETELGHFEQLLKMDPATMSREQKINCGILGLKAAGLNKELRADSCFGKATVLACDEFQDGKIVDQLNVNLALAGLSPMNPQISLDGVIGAEAMTGLERFRELEFPD